MSVRLMVDLIYLIIQKLLDWGIPFGLGLLFRKKVGRFLILVKKRLFNDIITISLVSVRHYAPCEISEFDYRIYEDIKTKLPSPKLLNMFPNGIRISLPVFGNIRVFTEKILSEEESNEQAEETDVESIKVTITPESPIRLGVREIDKLNDFGQYIEVIFGAIEKYYLEEGKILQSYTIVEAPRIEYFREEKTFQFEDSELDATVRATPSSVTIIVKPSTKIWQAAKRYILI